jgi:curved DNA-binding protein
VKLKIPAGTQSGKKFRLPGMGLPLSADTRGDLFAEIRVTVPDSLGEKEKVLWETIADFHKP